MWRPTRSSASAASRSGTSTAKASARRCRCARRNRRRRAPYDRYSVGLHHLAFEAESREIVDERLAWARAQGLEIENEPQEWPYVPGYYAGFFHDPDGIKLEVVYVRS